jgi:hypothetical protein
MNGILPGTAWAGTDFMNYSGGVYTAVLEKRRQ